MSMSSIARIMALRFPGGIGGLAAQMRTPDGSRMNENLLGKKLSANYPNQLYADEAEQIALITQYPDLAVEHCSIVNLAAVPLPLPAPAGSAELVRGFADIGRNFSTLVAQFNDAISDNTISPNECDAFQRDMMNLIGSMIYELRLMRVAAETRAPVVSINRQAG